MNKPLRVASKLVLDLIRHGILSGPAARYWDDATRKNTTLKRKADLWLRTYTPEVAELEAALLVAMEKSHKMPYQRAPHVRRILFGIETMKERDDDA